MDILQIHRGYHTNTPWISCYKTNQLPPPRASLQTGLMHKSLWFPNLSVRLLCLQSIYEQTPTINPSILPGIVCVGCWQACWRVGGQVNVGCKLQQRDVILQRPWEVVPLVHNRVHCQLHISSDADVRGVDAGDVVLSEDEGHRPLGEEGEGGDAVSCSHRPVCRNQCSSATTGSLA